MLEIWKDIAGYEGYYKISNLGIIKSLERKRWNGKCYAKLHTKTLKQHIGSVGYHYISLSKNAVSFKTPVHRLLAKAFIPNPLNKKEVNHIDGNKVNNSLSNLEWVTPCENVQHAYKEGLMPQQHKVILITNKGIKKEFISKSKASSYVGRDYRYVSARLLSGHDTAIDRDGNEYKIVQVLKDEM